VNCRPKSKHLKDEVAVPDVTLPFDIPSAQPNEMPFPPSVPFGADSCTVDVLCTATCCHDEIVRCTVTRTLAMGSWRILLARTAEQLPRPNSED
jgi:hypothetical protein